MRPVNGVLEAAKSLQRNWDHRYEPDLNSGCFLWFGKTNRKGYGALVSRGKVLLAHRIAYAMSAGEDPGESFVLHSCDTPCCVNPNHLRPGTYLDNAKDRVDRGRSGRPPDDRRGAGNPNAKLTVENVKDIRASCLPTKDMAAKYRVSVGTIQDIRRFRRWKDIDS